MQQEPLTLSMVKLTFPQVSLFVPLLDCPDFMVFITIMMMMFSIFQTSTILELLCLIAPPLSQVDQILLSLSDKLTPQCAPLDQQLKPPSMVQLDFSMNQISLGTFY